MIEYVLIGPADEIKTFSSNVDPTVGTKPGWRWLPVERSTTGSGPVSGAPTLTALPDKVTIVTPLRDYTAQELGALRDTVVSGIDGVEMLLRAVALVLMDELNRHAAFETAMLAATAAATSLADFKTRMGQISAVPTRTAADVKTAIRNRLGT